LVSPKGLDYLDQVDSKLNLVLLEDLISSSSLSKLWVKLQAFLDNPRSLKDPVVKVYLEINLKCLCNLRIRWEAMAFFPLLLKEFQVDSSVNNSNLKPSSL
jgi:hypothetical protein